MLKKITFRLAYYSFFRKWLTEAELNNKYGIYCFKKESPFYIHYKDKDIPNSFLNFVGEYKPSNRKIYKVDNGYLCGPKAIPFDPNMRPISTRTRNGQGFMNGHRHNVADLSSCFRMAFLKLAENRSVSTYESIFPLSGIWSHGYFHWVVEYLPKIRAMRRYEKEEGVNLRVLLPKNHTSWQTEWLEILNIGRERCLSWREDAMGPTTLILTDHKMQTNGRHDYYDISLDDINWVRNNALSAVPKLPESPNKIYISRQSSTSRRVANFSDVEEVLLHHGFAICHMENMSVSEQVSTLSTADYIVGPHGAGLVNILFAPSHATLLELLPRVNSRPHFFRIAKLLNQNYHCIECEGTNTDEIHVDIKRFDERLSSLASSKNR